MVTAFAITAVNFMNVLDLTIAVVVAPLIAGNLGASPSQGTWILTIYRVWLATVQASTLGLDDTFMVCIWVAVPVLFLAMFIPAKLGPKPPNESDIG